MALTITIPGAVETTTGSTAPAVLTVGVGAPGVGVPSGGTTGQVLQKLSATSYDTGWATPSADFITSVTAPLAVATGNLTVDLSAYLPLSGGTLDANSTITASTATVNSLFAGDTFGVELTANPSENASLQYNGVQVQNAIGTMSVTASGLTFPNSSVQTVAYPGSSGFLLKANNLSDLASDSTARTNLGLGTMATATAADYSTTTAANLLYYPLSGNPSAFLVAADITGKADLASPAFTGNVTITTNSATAALTITQDGAGDILRLNDVAGDTTFTFVDALGKVNTVAATTASAGLNVAHGAAPTSPVNGDIWTTTSGLFMRQNGTTRQYVDLDQSQTINGNKTFSNATQTLGNSTAASTINIGTGATLTATTKAINIGTNGVSGSTTNITLGSSVSGATNLITVNGPMTVASSFTATGLNINIGNQTSTATYNFGTGAMATGQTRTIGIGTSALAGSTNNITIGSTAGTSTTTLQGTTTFAGPITGVINNISLGSGTGAQVMDFATGVTATGLTKAVSIGTNGASGSTTTIAIGGTAGTSTTTLNGTTNGITAAVDTNSVALATTAFVVGQAGSATPLVNGTAAVGTSLRYARQDHVHGTDTTRAALASPTFTGTPLSTTAAVDTNTTQIATTAYVVGQGYAKLASPTFTGTPTLPTGTIATTQSPGNNTTAVATTAFVTAAVPAFATFTTPGVSSTTTIVSPRIAMDYLMHPGRTEWLKFGNSATSGTGAAIFGGNTSDITARYNQMYGPNVSTAGYSMAVWDSTGSSLGMLGFTRGVTYESRAWNKGIWASGRGVVGTNSDTFNGDANCTVRVSVGGKSSVGSGAISATDPGFGWLIPGMGNAMQLQVSNGSAVTTVTSSFTPIARQVFDWKMFSDGTGNVTLWINDSVVATTAAGPSTATPENYNFYFEMVEQTASAAVRICYNSFNSRVWWGV